MTMLYVLLIVGVVLFALGMLGLHVRIVYEEELKVYLRVLFITICLFPRPTAKGVKIRAFKKGYPKEEKKKKKKKEKPKEKKKTEEPSLEALLNKVKFYIRVAMRILSRFKKHILLEEVDLQIALGGDDAAKTAITCGILSQSVAYLLDFLDKNFNCSPRIKSDVNVACDFASPVSTYRLALGARLRLWQILDIAIITAYNLFIRKNSN